MNLKLEILTGLIQKNQLKEFYNLTHNYLNNINKTKDPVILNLLGIYCHKTRDYIKAEKFFKDSLKINNNNQFVLQNLSAVLTIQGKINEAIEVLKKIIKLNPKDPGAYQTIAKLYDNLDQTHLGISTLEMYKGNIKDINFKYLQALLNYKDGSYEKSIDILLSIDEEKFTINIINLIALNYDNLFKFELARDYYQKALKLDPQNYDTLCNLGNFERALGNLDRAKEMLSKALLKTPESCRLHRYYSICHTYKNSEDDHLKSMLSILENYNNKKKETQKHLHELYFAIAKAYEDLKDLGNSCIFLKKGNELKKKSINNFNIGVFKQHNNMLKAVFSNPDLFKENIDGDDFNHIFVIGMPRSGTTLTEQIIAAHPDTLSAGELDYFQRIIKKFYPEKDSDKFIQDVKKNFEKDKINIRNQYIDKIKNRFSPSLTVINKLPNNFVFVGFIKHCFPKAKIVHMNRDPRSICLSIYKNYFPDNKLWYAYNEKDLTSYYNEYKSLINYWKTLYPDYIYDLSYEQLVSNSKNEIKKLLNFLELDWNEKVLEFNKEKNKISTVSTIQARKNIYGSSVKSWEKYEEFLPNLISEFKNLDYNT